MAYGSILSDSITDSSGGVLAPSSSVFRNRLINADMRIDQRNAGASVTPINGQYTLDRWQAGHTQTSKFSVQQSSTVPVGFTKSLLVTSLSAYSVLSSDSFTVQQMIEGYNVADLAWGTANAATVTLSFWVRSSLTGTFAGVLENSAYARSYPFTYTISSANTWEKKSITVTGDTTGTWNTDNTGGINVRFSLGAGSTYSGTAGAWAAANYSSATGATSVVGTNGATFYITGVQLEKGTTATSFDYRPYGTELSLCQRYYYRTTPITSSRICMAFASTTTIAYGLINFPVTMRSAPSALEQSGTAGNYGIAYLATASTCSSVPTFYSGDTAGSQVQFTVASGLTAGQGVSFYPTSTSGYLGWSAEL
jgi:hypothetical protein